MTASAESMATATCFEELRAWQLSEEMKEKVFELTGRERVARDRSFCDDIQRSARSAPANIAEGFGWFEPKPNAHYVSIAKASLEETKNHILDAFKRKHVSEEERDQLLDLTTRALKTTTRYLRYLRSCKKAPTAKAADSRNPSGTKNGT